MRIKVRLPKINAEKPKEPEICQYEGCGGKRFKAHGKKGEEKPVRDLKYEEVKSYRYKCMKCRRTFRVYPAGVSQAEQSDQLKGISVLLYVLGLSYGGVADFLMALGVAIGKTTVYLNVQTAGVKSRSRQQEKVKRGGKRGAIGTDGTYVKIKGEKVGVQVVVDDANGELLGIDIIVSENVEEVLDKIAEIAEQVEAEVLISDDLDTYKEVADQLGLDHQICRSHVKRNVDDLAEKLEEQLKKKEPEPIGLDSSQEQLAEDLKTLQNLVRERPEDAMIQLKQLYGRYKDVPHPGIGQRHDVWYRTRMLVTRLLDRWERLTLDQKQDDLDGTNNRCERLIGWWIKERYRTMRGYKRTRSVINVAVLTASMGANSGRYDMSELYG